MNQNSSNEIQELNNASSGNDRPSRDAVAGLVGRELDRTIAERVYGIKKIFRPCDTNARDQYWSPEDYHYIPSGKPPRTHMIDAVVVPHYSTDIAAAMIVIDKLDRHMEADYFPGTKLPWCVMFVNNEGEAAWAKSLPEAICIAALKTLDTASPVGEQLD